jgi:hypothetical protein
MLSKKTSYFLVTLLWSSLALFVIAAIYRQQIQDWWFLRSYEPSAIVASLSNSTTMTEKGQKLFYVHDPQLLDNTSFNEKCIATEKTIVLGCYDGIGIYIYDISDARLVGVEEVTAAHEMLHAAYERLESDEKEVLEQQLVEVASTITNPRLLKLFDSYKQKDEGQYVNELHSIIGTEVKELPIELEKHYGQYFTDRSVVVGYATAYEKVFTDLQDKVEKLDAELALRKSEINEREAIIARENSELEAQKRQLDAYNSSGDIANYNAAVPSYNAAVAIYNRDIAYVKKIIAEYNQLVSKRNAIAVTQNDLINNLSSQVKEIN